MKTKTLVISGAAIASAAAIGVAGASLASAGNDPANPYGYRTQGSEAPGAEGSSAGGYGQPGYGGPGSRPDGSGRGHGPRGVGGRLGQGLSGDTAVRAVQAAAAKEPTASVLRLGKADDGTYRVAMRRSDGTHVLLTLDAGFTVTNVQERAPRSDQSPRPTSTATSTT